MSNGSCIYLKFRLTNECIDNDRQCQGTKQFLYHSNILMQKKSHRWLNRLYLNLRTAFISLKIYEGKKNEDKQRKLAYVTPEIGMHV